MGRFLFVSFMKVKTKSIHKCDIHSAGARPELYSSISYLHDDSFLQSSKDFVY